jgi:hypothetical protein
LDLATRIPQCSPWLTLCAWTVGVSRQKPNSATECPSTARLAAGFKSGYTAVAHEALQAVIANKKLPLTERMLAWLQRNAWGNSSAHAIRLNGPALRLTDCAFDLSSPRGPISRAFKQLELDGYARRDKDGRLYPNPNPAPPPKSSSPVSDRAFFEALRESDPSIYEQWKEELMLRNQAQNRYRINTKKLRNQADTGEGIIIDERTIELKNVCGRAFLVLFPRLRPNRIQQRPLARRPSLKFTQYRRKSRQPFQSYSFNFAIT